MTKQTQKTASQPDKKPSATIEPAASEAVNDLAASQLAPGLLAAAGSGSVQGQATRLNDRRLLTAQRQALAGQIGYLQGNRHLQRVIAFSSGAYAAARAEGRRTAPAAIQRRDETVTGPEAKPQQSSPDVPEDRNKLWADAGGDELIDAVKQDISQWRVFRRVPFSYKTMPGDAASAAIRKFMHNRLGVEPWMKFHASSKIGPEDLAMLKEMASMNVQFATEAGDIFNITKEQDLNHEYTCKAHAAVGLAQGAVQTVAPALDIGYKNKLGLNWSHTYYIPGVNFSLGLSADPIPFDVEYDPSKPNPIQPSVEKSVDVVPGVEAGLLQLNINGEAKAKSLNFLGPNDLEGGVEVITGPTAEANKFYHNVKFSTGSAVGFTAPPTPLWFENWDIDINSLNADNFSVSKKLAPKIKFAVVGAGAGIAIGSGVASVGDLPEYGDRQIVKDARQWATSWIYPTGQALPPEEAVDKLVKLKRQILNVMEQLRIQDDRDYLKAKGIDLAQAMALNISVVGYASRMWQGAQSDQQRVNENEGLALERSTKVLDFLETLFSDYPGSVSKLAMGGGPGTPGPSQNGPTGPQLNDPEAQATYEAKKEEVNKRWDEKKKEALQEPDPAIRKEWLANIEKLRQDELKMMDNLYGPNSDVAQARRVDITVSWDGLRVAHELPAVPVKEPAL